MYKVTYISYKRKYMLDMKNVARQMNSVISLV